MPIYSPGNNKDGLGISNDSLGSDFVTSNVVVVDTTLKQLNGHEVETKG